MINKNVYININTTLVFSHLNKYLDGFNFITRIKVMILYEKDNML